MATNIATETATIIATAPCWPAPLQPSSVQVTHSLYLASSASASELVGVQPDLILHPLTTLPCWAVWTATQRKKNLRNVNYSFQQLIRCLSSWHYFLLSYKHQMVLDNLWEYPYVLMCRTDRCKSLQGHNYST